MIQPFEGKPQRLELDAWFRNHSGPSSVVSSKKHPETTRAALGPSADKGNEYNKFMSRTIVRRITFPLIQLVYVGCFGLVLGSSAFGYSCGDPSSGHCYGVTSWQEQPEYFGAYTHITRAAVNCPSGCNGFVDDEIWLVDSGSSACTSNPFGQCWVEAGYFFTDGSGSAQYFWADSRPMNTNTFNLHILGPTDAAGTTSVYWIIKDGTNGPGIFQVWVNPIFELARNYHATSTSNTMTGNRVIIGQELAGSSGASAGNANFSTNIWAVQALGPDNEFWFTPQTGAGNIRSDNPPFASWTIDPSTPPPVGGQFTTHCCS
jgi:hypothetical protein